MVLTGPMIREEIAAGNITITPFNEKQLNPNSYNVTLNKKLLVYDSAEILDVKTPPKTKTIIIPKNGIVLQPNQLYIGAINEYTETPKYFPALSGRSSIGRLGINIHATAGFGDVGFCGKWTLEIFVIRPVRVYADIEIGQIYYQEVVGDIEKYHGKYQGDIEPNASKLFTEFT